MVLSHCFGLFFLLMAQAGGDLPTVLTQKVETTELFEVLTYPARVIPKVNSTILAESDGVVTRIFAPLGRSVKRGEKILEIRNTDPVYQYAPVVVRASATGIVSSLEVGEGTQVAKGQRLLSVMDPSQLKVTIEIPAQDLPEMTAGKSGVFKSTALKSVAGEIWNVKVLGVSGFVDPATGTATAELEATPEFPASHSKKLSQRSAPPTLPAAQSAAQPAASPATPPTIEDQLTSSQARAIRPPVLTPGLIGQATFKASVKQGLSIPEHSLFYKGNLPFVRVLTHGKANQIAVQLGRRRSGMVEVVTGLQPGDVLIERTSRFLSEGEAVKVDNPAASSEPSATTPSTPQKG